MGLLEVVSEPFRDTAPIWRHEVYPARVKVKTFIRLSPETGVPVYDLRDSLSIFTNMKSPVSWVGRVRASAIKWSDSDGEIVHVALLEAEKNPVKRPYAVSKTERPEGMKVDEVIVTVPETPNDEESQQVSDSTSHTEIQWLLLKLGSEMGFGLWVARNDRGKEFLGQRFVDVPGLRKDIPRQFDEITNKTIELIDVLWLNNSAIIAAFEIESTTSIYSGLLRMSDPLAMQPNLSIPLYIVAPDERRDKVITEV